MLLIDLEIASIIFKAYTVSKERSYMATLQVDNTTKQELQQLAREENRSEQDILKGLLAAYRFEKARAKLKGAVAKKFYELRITTVDQAEQYLG